ncbi:MAG: long-chain fatty acid--CoA ligase, partial [Promethearchaeota archaeon]
MVVKYIVDESRPFFGKFWPNDVPHQLDIDFSMTMGDLLDRAVKNWGDDPAIWFLDTFVTYKELEDKANRFATYLDSIGVKKGDVVALHLPNCIQYVIAYYGCAKIGAIVTGINPTYKPLEILHQLKLTGAKYILALDALYYNFVKPIESKWEFKKVIWTNLVDEASGMSSVLKLLG